MGIFHISDLNMACVQVHIYVHDEIYQNEKLYQDDKFRQHFIPFIQIIASMNNHINIKMLL